MNIIKFYINNLSFEKLFYIFLGIAFLICNFRLIIFGLINFLCYFITTFSFPSFLIGYVGHFLFPWKNDYYLVITNKSNLFLESFKKFKVRSYLKLKQFIFDDDKWDVINENKEKDINESKKYE